MALVCPECGEKLRCTDTRTDAEANEMIQRRECPVCGRRYMIRYGVGQLVQPKRRGRPRKNPLA